MDIDPELIFHRYFSSLNPTAQSHFRGKYDLTKPSRTDFDRLLVDLKDSINDSLNSPIDKTRHQSVSPQFHFDYIDSDLEHAMAFRHDGYSFIGVTEPLVNKAWVLCDSLGRFTPTYLRPALRNPVDPDSLRVVFFRILLFFIVAHEYTHHVHGNSPVTYSQEDKVAEEAATEHADKLDDQAFEIDADGYATHIVLRSLVPEMQECPVFRF